MSAQESREEAERSISHMERLPVELRLKVLTSLPDLLCLDSILRASPATYRMFGNYAVEITDAILAHDATCGHIRVIICIIAYIRSSTLPAWGLYEFEERVTREALRYRVRPSSSGFAPVHLPKDTTPAVIQSILATNRRLAWLSFSCLEFYTSRFKPLRPDRLADRNYKRRRDSAEEAPPKAKKVEIEDIGPPTWVEEQRVSRVFWRLQLIYDLKMAATHSLLAWPQADIDRLKRRDVMDFYGDNSHEIPYDEISRLPPEYEEMLSIMAFLQEAHERKWPTQAAVPLQVKRPWPLSWPVERDWRHLELPSTAYLSYKVLFFEPLLAKYWPHRAVPWESYRRLGFALWSPERLCAYGIPVPLRPTQAVNGRIQSAYYVWQSIIPPNEDADEMHAGAKVA